MLKKAPKGTFANKIYEKRNKTDVCVFRNNDNKSGNGFERPRHKIFALAHEGLIYYYARITQTLLKCDVFTSQKPLLRALRTSIISKTLKKEVKKFLDTCVTAHLQFAFYKKFIENMPNLTGLAFAKLGGKDGFMIYDNLETYIEDHTFFEALNFKKLDFLFRAYFIFLVSILIIFLTQHLLIFTYHYLSFFCRLIKFEFN